MVIKRKEGSWMVVGVEGEGGREGRGGEGRGGCCLFRSC